MKLWHSFVKEMILASRSFYFYIEIGMAALFVFLLLFVIPETFTSKQDEFIYYDVPPAAREQMVGLALETDLDGVAESAEFKLAGETVTATRYESEDKRVYVVDDEATAIALADNRRAFAAVIHMDEQGDVTYTYYMQGYETERLRNIYKVAHNVNGDVLAAQFDKQQVRAIYADQVLLSDRENVIPSFLTFNGSLMGLFLVASYIFLDKKEGVIKAYAVTASSVWQYLLSKVGVIMVTSTITSLLIVLPIMGLQPNYLILLILLLTSGFFASSLGLLLTSFYDNIMQAFGVLYLLIIILILPALAYFIPGWNPIWVRIMPTHPMIQGFKEALLPNGDVSYVLLASLGFMVFGALLFYVSNIRFKQTLTV
jgi:hypothetical protein